MKKIIVDYLYPPIPIRNYDYGACYENEEEFGYKGYGKTKEGAIQDLKDNTD